MAAPLISGIYCKQSSKAKLDYLLENGLFQHEELDGNLPDFGGRIGGENLALHHKSDTLDQVVDGWMASPHHRAVIMDPDFKYAGYASGLLPASFETITMGPGVYLPDSGTYSTEPMELPIPEADRGQMKLYCLHMTATD